MRSRLSAAMIYMVAIGVLLSTAATDAVYVFFNAAVSARRRVAAASWSSDLAFALGLCGNQLHGKLGYVLFAAAGGFLSVTALECVVPLSKGNEKTH